MTMKNGAESAGDAGNDLGNAGNDLTNGSGDPANNAANAGHDVADAARAVGLGGVGDAIDNILDRFDGPIPPPTYLLYFGKESLAEQGAGMAEGLLGDAANSMGGIGGSILGDAVDRASKELNKILPGSDASAWKVYTFQLKEGYSRPWELKLTLQRTEVKLTPSDATATGPLTSMAQGVMSVVNDVKSGNVGDLVGMAESMAGIGGPTDSSPTENPVYSGVPIDPGCFLNQPASISVSRRMDGTPNSDAVVERWLTGVVSEFQDLGGTLDQSQKNLRFVNITIVPSLWLLSLRRDCRIFQNMNAIEIVREVFETASVYAGLTHGMVSFVDNLTDGVHLVPDKVAASDWTAKREMCVQYNETDLDFVHRLLEEEGISYYFDCERRTERIVFIDNPSTVDKCRTVDGRPVPFVRSDEIVLQHPKPPSALSRPDAQPQAQPEVIWSFNLRQRKRPNRVTLRDHNFNLASMVTAGTKDPPNDKQQMPYLQEIGSPNSPVRDYTIGQTGAASQDDDFEVYLGSRPLIAPTTDPLDAQKIAATWDNYAADPATRMRDTFRAEEEIAIGEGNVTSLRPGVVVRLTGFVSYRTKNFPTSALSYQSMPSSNDPNAAADYAAAKEANHEEFADLDDIYKQELWLLVTNVTHFGHDASLPAYAPPKGVVGGRTDWNLNTPSTVTLPIVGALSTPTSTTQVKETMASPPPPLLDFQPPGKSGDLQKQEYYNRFECIVLDSGDLTKYVFRPPQGTPRPRIIGIQTALVVNPDNHFSDNMEHQLWVEAATGHRVKLHFHWDRRGDKLIESRKSSCWVRVAQMWAGAQDGAGRDWGTMFIPRAGMEAIVAFQDGNPDRPVVIGCVPNGHHAPATSPYPAVRTRRPDGTPSIKLEDENPPAPTLSQANHRYRSVISSQSEPYSKPAGNALVFDDNYPKEWVQLKAQNKLIREVKQDYAISVGDPQNTYSENHMQQNAVQSDQLENVTGDVAIKVTGPRTKTVVQREVALYHADRQVTVGDVETLGVDRARVATIDGFEKTSIGPDVGDPSEPPDKPRRKVVLNGSQSLNIDVRTDDPKDDSGDEDIYVKLGKTDKIKKKLKIDTKKGVGLKLNPPGGTSIDATPDGIQMLSETTIDLSSDGIVTIRSDNNDVMLEGDQGANFTTHDKKLALTLAGGSNQDVVLSGETADKLQGIRIMVQQDGSSDTATMTLDDKGIHINITGTIPSSLEIPTSGPIAMKGNFLKMWARDTVTGAGNVTFLKG